MLAARGVLANDLGPDPLSAKAGHWETERGGGVDLAADGSFVYTPPDPVFWGDDHFTYALLGSDPESSARVRLTVQPGLLQTEELAGGKGNGFAVGDAFVTALAGAGDVNGDGLADLVVTSSVSPTQENAYVAFGKASAQSVSLGALASAQGGFEIRGAASDGTGLAVSAAGDVNGDGLDDILLGAPATTGGGAAYVIFGKRGGEPVELGNLSAGAGFAILPNQSVDNPLMRGLGTSVAAAGDVNGDGFADVLIGNAPPLAGTSDLHSAYVVLGSAKPGLVYLADLNGYVAAPGVAQFQLPAGQELSSIAGAGDFDGDGLDDVLLGVPSPALGRAYLIFGGNIAGRLVLEDASDSRFNVISGWETVNGLDNAGQVVSSAGDTNGDGLDDVLIGAHTESPTAFTAGRAYVLFGRRTRAPFSLEVLTQEQNAGFAVEGAIINDFVGTAVASPGDLDGDGLTDILVGASGVDQINGPNNGMIALVFGRAAATTVPIQPLFVQNSLGLAILGSSPRGGLGTQVSRAGDVNGDGLGDFITKNTADPKNALVFFGWDANDAIGDRDTVLLGTSADDTLEAHGQPLLSVSGGHGFDTLRVQGDGVVLDLTRPMPHVTGIERINLSGGGASTLRLDDSHIRRLPENRPGPAGLIRTLIVEGDAADTLVVDLGNYDARTETNGGRTVYQSRSGPYGLEVSPSIRLVNPRELGL